MSAVELLDELGSAGVRLVLTNGKLKLCGPAERITDEIIERTRACKAELLAALQVAEEKAKLDEPVRTQEGKRLPSAGAPAYSIIATCQRLGVLLRIDQTTGELVIGREPAEADQVFARWPSLRIALEAHLDGVAALVAAGWILKACSD